MKRLFKKIIGYHAIDDQSKTLMRTGHQKYKKSGLTREQAFKIKNRIEDALIKDKLYRNNELGLGELSEYIQQDRYKVSEVINTYYCKNFYALLNSCRIKEAKFLLMTNRMLSVKAIMYEVGFNSKNSFYLAFKKDTGLSPNEFRNTSLYSSPSQQQMATF